jgi:hypothetical protein
MQRHFKASKADESVGVGLRGIVPTTVGQMHIVTQMPSR